MNQLRLGIIATGNIARRLATAMQNSTTCKLVAASSRSKEKAHSFAAEFKIDAVMGYEALLERDDIEAVYVATPHPQHHEWCLKAIAAGKHVLCEKPLAMNPVEAEEMMAEAKTKGVLVLEAFMYRFHPQTRKLVGLLAAKTIGEVCWIHTDFGFAADYDPAGRLFSNTLGGGGILDVGCYTISMARLIAGAATDQLFLDPIAIHAMGRLNENEGTDWLAGAMLKFPSDVFATVRCATRFALGQGVWIEGTLGTIEVNEPWFAGCRGASICVKTKNMEITYKTEIATDLYSFMLDEFAECVRDSHRESTMMSSADSIGNMRAMEEWYRQIGVSY